MRNVGAGLDRCAGNLGTGSVVQAGTGAVRMPGDTCYHVVERTTDRFAYKLWWYMGGVAEGSRVICQPEGGFYPVHVTPVPEAGGKARLATHTYPKFKKEVAALATRAGGDTAACHGFMGRK